MTYKVITKHPTPFSMWTLGWFPWLSRSMAKRLVNAFGPAEANLWVFETNVSTIITSFSIAVYNDGSVAFQVTPKQSVASFNKEDEAFLSWLATNLGLNELKCISYQDCK